MTKPQLFLSPDQIAEVAERLYDNTFRSKYEGAHNGKFLAIDVVNEKAYLGQHPEDALKRAGDAVPDGMFYLVRIGETAAFNVGYIGEQESELDRSIRPLAHSLPGLQPA